MRVVELMPGCPHFVLIAKLHCGRRAPELHERRVGAVAKAQELSVDSATLPRQTCMKVTGPAVGCELAGAQADS